jgi:transposase-like protein
VPTVPSGSWRLDETYVKIKGKSASLYRAVDKEGHTIDFLLTPNRDRNAAEPSYTRPFAPTGSQKRSPLIRVERMRQALTRYNKTHKTAITMRHCKSLNTIVEQDHRAVQWLTRPMLGFKSLWAARCTIAGMEVMPAIRKGQLTGTGTALQTPAEQFYALVA